MFMIRLLFVGLMFCLPCFIFSQSSYQEAITLGDQALEQRQFQQAINYYFAAEAFDPSKSEVVKMKVNYAFQKIQALNQQLQQKEQELQLALVEADSARTDAQVNLDKANKLIDAFYFYKDRFALAYGREDFFYRGAFYFINKDGDYVEKLGNWSKAEQFDSDGWAKVIQEKESFLLDTFGNTYKAAFSLKELTKTTEALDLRDIELDFFPYEIFQHTQLKVLLLSDCEIIPKEIEKLVGLTHLSIDKSKSDNLPVEIGQLSNLTHLTLRSLPIKDLHFNIGNLSNLQHLDLSGTNLKSVPQAIGKLSNLIFLNLEDTDLKKLPAEIGQLSNLQRLNLLGADSLDMASFITAFKNYPKKIQIAGSGFFAFNKDGFAEPRVLRFRSNGFLRIKLEDDIDPVLSEDGLLIEFDFPYEMEFFPEEILQLVNLTYLDLTSLGELTNISKNIGKLSRLTHLFVESETLDSLPVEVGQLSNLTHLFLYCPNLEFLPLEIGKLNNLKTLIIYGKIHKIPSAIGNLTSLTSLIIAGGGELEKLPANIGKLTNLKSLAIINSNLKSFPAEIGKLTNLKRLTIFDDRIETLPAEIGYLNNLSYLYLSAYMKKLPKVIGQLSNLSHLHIYGVSLDPFPPEIGQLSHLIEFRTFNRLGISPEISKLKNLRVLEMSLPVNGYKKILSRFRELLPNTDIQFVH